MNTTRALFYGVLATVFGFTSVNRCIAQSYEYTVEEIPVPSELGFTPLNSASTVLGQDGEIGIKFIAPSDNYSNTVYSGVYYQNTWYPLESGITTFYHGEKTYQIEQFFNDHSVYMYVFSFAFGVQSSSAHEIVSLAQERSPINLSAADPYISKEYFRFTEADAQKRILISGVGRPKQSQSKRAKAIGRVASVILNGVNVQRLPFGFHGNTISDSNVVGGFINRYIGGKPMQRAATYNFVTDTITSFVSRLPAKYRGYRSEIRALNNNGDALIEAYKGAHRRRSTWFFVSANAVTKINASGEWEFLDFVSGRCGMNSSGQIIGSAISKDDHSAVLLFDPQRGLLDLSTIADFSGLSGGPYTLTCINDGGQILLQNLVLLSPNQ